MKATIISLFLSTAMTAQNIDSISSIAQKYLDQGNYIKSLENNLYALDLYKIKENKKGEARQYNNISALYRRKKEYPKALEYLYESIKICRDIKFKKGEGYAIGNIANTYTTQGKDLEAEKYYKYSIQLFKNIKDKKGEANFKLNLGNLYIKEKRYEDGIRELRESKSINKTILCNFNIGEYYIIKNQYVKAKKYFDTCEVEYKKTDDIDGLKDTYKELSVIYDSLKDKTNAFEYYKRYVLLKDSIENNENTKKFIQTEMQYKFDKKDVLREAESQRQKATIRFTVIISLLVLALLIFSVVNYRNLKNQKQLIQEKQNELMASIRYAKRIQTALMASEKSIGNMLNRLVR